MNDIIRGFIGEQSFEIREADARKVVDRYCEALVYGSVYRTSLKRGEEAVVARSRAHEAVRSFRRTADEPQ